MKKVLINYVILNMEYELLKKIMYQVILKYMVVQMH